MKNHISKRCGKTPQWYSDISRGRRRMYLDDFLNVADALGEDPRIFFEQKVSVTRNKKSA